MRHPSASAASPTGPAPRLLPEPGAWAVPRHEPRLGRRRRGHRRRPRRQRRRLRPAARGVPGRDARRGRRRLPRLARQFRPRLGPGQRRGARGLCRLDTTLLGPVARARRHAAGRDRHRPRLQAARRLRARPLGGRARATARHPGAAAGAAWHGALRLRDPRPHGPRQGAALRRAGGGGRQLLPARWRRELAPALPCPAHRLRPGRRPVSSKPCGRARRAHRRSLPHRGR